MLELLLLSLVGAAGMAAAALGVASRRPDRELMLRVGLGTLAAMAASLGLGTLVGVETPAFLIGASLAAAPVIVLLTAAAEEVAPGRLGVVRALIAAWCLGVFPLALVIPPALARACGGYECRVEDFGAGLALFVSSAAMVLLAGGAAARGSASPASAFFAWVCVLWISCAVWLVSLEGAIDAYTGRILLAAALAPLGGALGWLAIDLARRRRHPLRSLADGIVAGLVAIVPGAATIAAPWSLVVGAIAGVAAALVYGARGLNRAGGAAHWALVVLTSTAVGFLAPAVAGDTIGLLVSGRVTALVPPLLEFSGVTALGIAASVPIWLAARWNAGTRKPPV